METLLCHAIFYFLQKRTNWRRVFFLPAPSSCFLLGEVRGWGTFIHKPSCPKNAHLPEESLEIMGVVQVESSSPHRSSPLKECSSIGIAVRDSAVGCSSPKARTYTWKCYCKPWLKGCVSMSCESVFFSSFTWKVQ